MHMHLHLSKSLQNYGPVTAFWCFPFERFHEILGTFQKNWISPEQQMAKNSFLINIFVNGCINCTTRRNSVSDQLSAPMFPRFAASPRNASCYGTCTAGLVSMTSTTLVTYKVTLVLPRFALPPRTSCYGDQLSAARMYYRQYI